MKETSIPRNKKLSSILAIVFLVLIVLGGIFHFWFINNTEKIFENIVLNQSQGQIKLNVEKVSFNYFSRNIRLQQARFISEDTLTASNIYQFNVSDLNLRVKSIRSLIFNQEILIDSLTLLNPHVTIRHIRNSQVSVQDSNVMDEDFSIAREMGKIYRSIEDGLNLLQIRYFKINEGKFSLVNAMRPNDPPINISHIFLEVDNIAINDAQKKDTAKFLFSDNIILRTHDQEIVFPGGRHRLSFGAFQMNVKDKKIEIENCSVSGEKSDTSTVAFNMLFRKLQLLNFDFAALANDDLIKADSVYCQDPEFRLSLLLKEKTEAEKNQPFQLDELLRQVGSNMEIKFAGLSNANVEITTTRNNNPVVFSSEGNDLFLYDFNIDNAASKPIQIGGIDVAIRNYDMVTRDGSTAIRFDSIQLRNNTMRLNNFSLTPTGQVLNQNIRNINVPLLQITGFSWENLLIDRTFIAEKATLYNPQISYRRINQSNRQQSFFDALSGIDELMEVEQLELVNGNVKLVLNDQQSFELENINFSIMSNEFISSQTIGNIEKSIEEFKFSKGMINLNNLQILLNDVKYTGEKEQLHASTVTVNDANSQSSARLQDVFVTNLSVNEALKKFSVDSVRWDFGNIAYLPTEKKKRSNKSSSEINIHNISGKHTNITTVMPAVQMNMEMDWIKADKLSVISNEIPVIDNLSFSGQNFTAHAKELMFLAGSYTIVDGLPSTLNQVIIEKNSKYDSLNIIIPTMNVTPSVSEFIRNEFSFETIELFRPSFRYLSRVKSPNTNPAVNFPEVFIEDLRLNQPTFNIKNFTGNSENEIALNGIIDNYGLLQLKQIFSDSQKINIGAALLQSKNLIIDDGNKIFGVDTGNVRMSVTGIELWKEQDLSLKWKGEIQMAQFDNPLPFNLPKKSQLTLDSIVINNLDLGSHNNDLLQQLKNSPALKITGLTGKLEDTASLVRWYNGQYDHSQKTFALDSFNYRPVLERDNYISAHPYQTDYLTGSTGAIKIRNINIEKYLEDSILEIGGVQADNAAISVYRNKLLPRKPVSFKYLPTAALKNISQKFRIDSINLKQANISYTELSEHTKDTGTIFFTKMNAFSGPYTNMNTSSTDSLRIHASGYIFDKGVLNLQFHQSYQDSLSGFNMAMQANLTDAEVINQMLVPITNVSISSGNLDSLRLKAAGNDIMAKGEIIMLYNNLRIQINKNNSEKPSLKDKITSFIANNFIIRSHNSQQKTGIIFFERWQDRSVFNYLVKILVSGISTSIGLKSNAKILKEYELHRKKQYR
jgi:hypothetical protein